jgi:hypothetical protein
MQASENRAVRTSPLTGRGLEAGVSSPASCEVITVVIAGETGTYTYHCQLHPREAGTVMVMYRVLPPHGAVALAIVKGSMYPRSLPSLAVRVLGRKDLSAWVEFRTRH